MTKLMLLAGVLLALNFSVFADVSGPRFSDLPEYSKAYDPARDPFQDSRDALELARKTGRLVLIEVGGDWCTWCHLLDRFIQTNREVYNSLYANYIVLKVNTSEENDNKEFLSGLPKTNGYPHLFIANSDGTVIYSTDVTRLLKNGSFVAERVLALLGHWLKEKSKPGQTLEKRPANGDHMTHGFVSAL